MTKDCYKIKRLLCFRRTERDCSKRLLNEFDKVTKQELVQVMATDNDGFQEETKHLQLSEA